MEDQNAVSMSDIGIENKGYSNGQEAKQRYSHSYKDTGSTVSTGGSAKNEWRVGTKQVFCLLLAAAVVVAAVGVLVYFLHPDKGRLSAPATSTTTTPQTTIKPTTTASTTTTQPTPPVDVRLSKSLVPESYELRLCPDLYGEDPAMFVFTGKVKIHLNAMEDTRNITLHSKQLTISKIQITKESNGKEIEVDRVESQEANETIHIHVKDELLVSQKYSVSLTFEGRLSNDLAGIYYSTYTNAGGEEEYLMTSQLQATDSRKVFPCFDEPALKAKFTVSIERKVGYNSMGNTLIRTTEKLENEPDWEVDHYFESPLMSTYLLAFMVSKFQCKSSQTESGTIVEICARPNAMHQVDYALEVAVPMQQYFEWYHDVPYPLQKTTHVAIPDFAAGAMENWGLIMYRETALLYDTTTTSASSKQWVTIVIAHELAHMWFGNLVTPEWWDDIWLNEGFASWMENLCTENVTQGQWQMEPQFVVNDMQYVMRLDGLATSHPVYQAVNHPSEIDALFDTITYSKGAAVIRMMQHFLGEDTFRWGLANYLKNRAYQAAHHDDLFRALTKEAAQEGINVTEIMYTWIRQMGYPVIDVSYNNESGSVSFQQKHFLLDRSKITERPVSEFGYLWNVPITVETNTDVSASLSHEPKIYWLNTEKATLTNAIGKDGNWILVNIRQHYYYRVNYDRNMWDSLIYQLNRDHTQIEYVENRAQIIDDAMSLGRAGEIEQLVGLRATEYLDQEEEYVPWVAAVNNLAYLDSMLELSPSYTYLRTYMQQKTASHHDHLGWNDDIRNDPHLQQRMRRLIIGRACYYELESCVKSATQAFTQWMEDPVRNVISANLQVYVYCNGIRYGAAAEWNFVYEKYLNSSDSTEQSTFLNSLACTRQEDLLNGFMERALDEEIRRQDFRSVIVGVSRNPSGRVLAWNFLRANWDTIFNRFGSSTFTLGRIITGLTESFSTIGELKELEAFKERLSDVGSAVFAFNQAIETVNINIAWRVSHESSITEWLKEKTEDSPQTIRLKMDVVPTHYDLTIRPDIYGSIASEFKFTGSVAIEITVEKSTETVTLHYKLLTIDHSSIEVYEKDDSQHKIDVVASVYEKEKDFYHITLSTNLKVGEVYIIAMLFTGPLTNDLAGIYSSSYTDENGTTQYIIASQLQATDARKVFPCFDEPAIKATFTVTIERKEPFTTFCNTEIQETIDIGEGWLADKYYKTPMMSTYLLAFVVSQFDCRSTHTTSGKKIDLCARKELIEQVNFPLTFAAAMQEYFEEYHDIDVPLDKMAHVAVPDFASGAMENWGLILYREYALLYDPQSTDVRYKQYLTYVVAHELAHQWFGNLVTPTWWDDIWLNEGFASWMMIACTDAIFPAWKMEEQFVVSDLQKVMALDGLISSHPVYQPVNHPNEISSLFDTITYSKGSTVIRMMKHFLGPDIFRWGLSKYLKDRAYDSATHNDLFNTLTQEALNRGRDVNVTRIMNTWILQMGYPVIETSYNPDSGHITIEQKHFLLDPSKLNERPYSPFKYVWEVPMTVVSDQSAAEAWDNIEPSWLSELSGEISTSRGAQWILLNPGVTNYYRTNYDASMWDTLINVLNTNHKSIIKEQNRAQLIDDSFALGRAGEIDQLIALRMTQYLDKETDYVPWLSAVTNVKYLNGMFQLSSTYNLLKEYMQMKLEPIHTSLGWQEDVENDPHLEQKLRYTLLYEACHYGLSSCITQATNVFALWMEDPNRNRVSPNLQEAAYCSGVREGDAAEWNFVLSQYKDAASASQAAVFIRALGCTKHANLLNSYLERALDEEIRRGDFSAVISAVAGNPSGRSIAWNFLRGNWERIYEKYGQSTFALTKIINDVTASFSTNFELEELRNFKSSIADVGTAGFAFDQAIEKTSINIDWRTANEHKIQQWLEETLKDRGPGEKVDVRLPKTLTPVHYWLRIRPDIYTGDPKTFGFNATSTVEIEVLENTNVITLHARSLVMSDDDWKLYNSATSPITITNIHYDDSREFFHLTSEEELKQGERYYVEVSYTGPVDDTLLGIYWSSYKNNSVDEYLLASQIQATHARKVFPCFDEPGIKSLFNITMEYRAAEGYTTKGNTDVWKSEPLYEGWQADHYRQTPKMSTYLLAFVISKFECLENTTREGVSVEVCTRSELIDQAKFSNTFANEMQQYYEDYFDIKYPLPRMTHAAVPDFSFNAMENWGLILYRETAILYDPQSSSAANRQRVAIFIAHELAHQWFGNLVTPAWWDDLWLNEGFASWMEILCTHDSFPTWAMDDQFVVEDLQAVMKLDGLATSHPVYQSVNDPGEIDALFDTITYSKGASVNRMMYYFLGNDIFRWGLSTYLKERSYQSAQHDQLFSTLTRISMQNYSVPINVTRVMHTWIKQMGYPVVQVEYEPSTGHVTLTQKHFLLDPSKEDDRPESPFDYVWEVPFTCVTDRDIEPVWNNAEVSWFSTQKGAADCTAGSSWVIANVGQRMYYRVNYDEGNWERLIDTLKTDPEKIKSVANRAQIIDDAFNLGRSGDLDQLVAMRVTEYLDLEMKYVPWWAATVNLDYIKSMLQLSPVYGDLQRYMQMKTAPHHDRLGWGVVKSGQHIDEKMRLLIVEEACSYDVDSCVANATTLFNEWMVSVKDGNLNPILPDLRLATYCNGVRNGGSAEWQFVFDQYPNAESANEANNYIRALACTNLAHLLNSYLSRALNSEIRLQDFQTVIVSVSQNPNGRALAWNFFRANWDAIRSQFGDSPFTLSRMVSGITDSFSTAWELQELRNFRNNVPDAGSAIFAFEQAIESTGNNVAWRKENEAKISQWLQQTIMINK